MKRKVYYATALTLTALLAMAARAVPVKLCVITGHSMEPMMVEGEICWMDGFAPRVREICPGDVVVFRRNNDVMIKRVVGVPGDTICEHVGVRTYSIVSRCQASRRHEASHRRHLPKGERVLTRRLDKRQYYVVGDNLKKSLDSRDFGPISDDQILGVVRPLSAASLAAAVGEWLRVSPVTASGRI